MAPHSPIATLPVRVAALYIFTPFADPLAVRDALRSACEAHRVRGTLLIASEGLNGTIAGTPDGIAAVLATIRALPGCAGVSPKYSGAATMPFGRLKVRIKCEIVTMGQPAADPLAAVGHYVAPADWNALIAQPDVVLIDTRNDYEVALGTFEGAIDPATPTFRAFPDWFRANRAALEAQGTRFAMFCTGGIRCEKATAFLKAEGVEDVFHLRGGILQYLEDVPAADSRWQGECFVFDERVSVGHGLVPGDRLPCRACRATVSAADRASPLFEDGVSCPACHGARNEGQRAGYRERERQCEREGQRTSEPSSFPRTREPSSCIVVRRHGQMRHDGAVRTPSADSMGKAREMGSRVRGNDEL